MTFVVTLLVLSGAVNASVPIDTILFDGNSNFSTSSSRVHNINKSSDYLTIQAAIDDASSGNVIYVDSDIYYENVNINKQLFLKGINTGTGNPVVDAQGSGNVITLSAGNSTLEGFEVVGSSWLEAGILVRSNDNFIRNNYVSNSYKGIFLDESSHSNTLIGNNVSNNGIFGIFLGSSRNNILRDNHISKTISDGSIALYLGASSDNTIDGNNIINNQWIGVYLDSSSSNNILNGNNVLNNTWDGITLWDSSSSNNMLNGNNVSNNKGAGISIFGSNNNILMSNNVLNNNGSGISIWGSNGIMLTRNNVFSNNGAGIYLRGSINNTLSNNNVFRNYNAGISLGTDSDSNKLSGNNLINNSGDGISLWYYSDNNTINGNIVSNNLIDGISLVDYSNNNIIYNNFFNNINNYKILNSLNIWNITKINNTNIVLGPYMGGNIWANPNGTGFSQTCEDNNGDEICDSTYTFENNSDYLPLAYFKNVPVLLSEGGVSISVLPRSETVLNGTSIILDIKAKNTQNIDDVFKIQINVSELPLSYQADPGWFNWTEQIVYLRAGQEIILPINISIPDTISGTKMFRAKMTQETSEVYAYDTGYLKII